ncbi:6-phosphogluconolactonase [Poseidonocella sedimentorum]|uniref:6-phosphogluconolactonase n=1 Tax=Poseidonocella sedimentorum TaxID=871652 RepID=A0A1I6CPF2_9RHOB|nr:6-phosphogluconolactonase [Poseidonocella sedimentorum]
MSYELIKYPDREAMMIDLAMRLADELESVLHHQPEALLVVPGGTTPGPIFDTLSNIDLEWSRVSVMLSDERWVPEDSPRSNTRLLRERLLTGRAAAATLLPLHAPVSLPEAALAELAEAIAPKLPISVLLLGMGADMHTASLFPGADLLDEALAPDAPLLLPMRAPGAPEPRITLSANALDGAMSKHIVITGAEKLEALSRAKSLSKAEAPVTAIWGDAVIHWAE